MFPTLMAYLRAVSKRFVIYAGCVCLLSLASVFFGLHGAPQARKNIPADYGISAASPQRPPKLVASYGKLPLSFEVNQGQTDPRAKFLSRGRGYTLFLTGDEAVLALAKPSAFSSQLSANQVPGSQSWNPIEGGGKLLALPGRSQLRTGHRPPITPLIQNPKSKIENEFVRLRLVGANPQAAATGWDELPGKTNHFIGNDPKKWRTNVPTYAKVRYHDVYPGVDLEYYGNQSGQLEYDFVVAPGADPSAITLHVGADHEPPVRIDQGGDLVVHLETGDLLFHRPVVYQDAESGAQDETRNSKLVNRQPAIVKRQFRQGRFVVDARDRIHFAVGPYDRTKPLVIDPVLSYSTYLGGSAGDWGYGIAVDSSGSAYVTGETASLDFPTVNPIQPNNNSSGLSTCFVAKLNPTGSALVYSTYLGGNGGDTGYGIAVDSSGSAYVAGGTYSPDFPTVSAFQSTNQSSVVGGTGFIAKLNASGSALVYSTYLGGSVADAVKSVAVDSSGNAHVTGYTLSIDFPITPGAFQTTGPGSTCNALTNPSPCDEAFVAELNASGSALVYSTYLGGSNYNAGFGIALDSSGNAYVAGTTTSIDFPTADPFQATLHGSSNAFVTKLNASGSGLIYSTYLGGSSLDQGTAISVDSSGSAYVTGYTASSDFPTVNPLQPTIGAQGHACGYVAKLNPSGSALVYSTYLGGSVGEMAFGIGVDGSGDAYVVGLTMSPNFPTVDPIQSVNQATGGALISPSTAFVSELNAAGSALIYSTYLGGSVQDTASAVTVDSSGNAYITGNTLSPDFPTVNPLQPTNNNAQQPGPTAFVAELSAGPAPAVSFSPAAFGFGGVLENTTSPQKTVTVTNLGNASLTITGITASGDFAVAASATSCFYTVSTLAPEANCTITVTFTPTALGVRTGAVMVTDNASGSPQALQLTGTGGLPAAIVSAAGLNFQAQNVGTASSPLAVTLTNTASVALPVSNVTISSGWAQSNNCVPSVGPSASCTINVTFQPTAGGYFTGTLMLTDEAVNSPQTVTLSGIGQGGPASLSPTSLVFGDQPVGAASLSQTITLVSPNNGGPGVPEFAISGDFQQDNSCDSMTNLTTDYPCPITIWFQPSAVGTRTGTLSVTYAQPTPTTLTASLTGIGVAPEASVAPAALTFGNQVQGTASSPQAVMLSNTGNASLVISNLTISGDFSETNTCGSSVAANTSCTVNVVFTPTAPGTRAGTLTINDNSNNVPGGSTQTVNLSGTGVGPVVSLSPTGLTFAAQTVSTQSAPQTITLTNTGTGALTPLTITASGDFAQTNTCTGSVGASASCTISATFKPTTGGARSGALTLTDNASNSPQTIQLSGTGMDFTMSSSATSQTVSPGQVANYSATLDPESGYDDTVNLTCTGAPSLSTCTLTPNQVTLNGTASATVAVAVSTTAPSLTPPQQWLLPPSLRGLGRMFWLYALLGLASLAALARARKRRAAYLLGGCLLLVVLWAACGGGGGQVIHTAGTPPGTYTVDVTATDATTSALAHTLQLTLTVN